MLKRGVSPVIATVLLISIVIVLAGIVFIWARGFVREGLEKRGEPIDRACSDVKFEADVVSQNSVYVLEINNQENVPLRGFDVKILGEGETRVENVPAGSIDVGSSVRINLTSDAIPELYESGRGQIELNIVPILMGARGGQQEEFTCPDETGIGVSVA